MNESTDKWTKVRTDEQNYRQVTETTDKLTSSARHKQALIEKKGKDKLKKLLSDSFIQKSGLCVVGVSWWSHQQSQHETALYLQQHVPVRDTISFSNFYVILPRFSPTSSSSSAFNCSLDDNLGEVMTYYMSKLGKPWTHHNWQKWFLIALILMYLFSDTDICCVPCTICA